MVASRKNLCSKPIATIHVPDLLVVAGAALSLIVAGCAHLELPARGTVAGQWVDTTVDARLARYYLEHYLRGSRSEPERDAELEAWHRLPADVLPTRAQLRELSRTHSVDFAALYFAQRLSLEPRSIPWQQAFLARLSRLRATGGQPTAHATYSQYLFLFVPGWDYVQYGPLTGADFARPRARLEANGLVTRLVRIPPTGSVEQNVDALVAYMRDLPVNTPPLILVSASSGGPATALALSERLTSAETCRVHAWINIGGLLRGTHLFDSYRAGPGRWIGQIVAWAQGWEWEALESLGRERGEARFASMRLPSHIRVINYIGIPLSGTVSPLARDRYLSLRRYGPNDGLTLIADALVPGQPTIPVLGQDHFLAEDPELDLKTLALALTLMEALDRDPREPCPQGSGAGHAPRP